MTTALGDLLPRLVHLLDANGVPFMVAGSVASTTYGLARSTQDIDVVIAPPSLAALEALVKSMPPDAYYVDLEAARDAWFRRSMFNIVDFASPPRCDASSALGDLLPSGSWSRRISGMRCSRFS